MRIMLTGRNGQVGSLIEEQLSTKYEVLALSREELDITNFSQVKKLVTQFKPNVIVNAAAYTAVDSAESDYESAFLINETGAGNLSKTASEVGAAVIYISTDYVFEGNQEGTYNENDKVNPQTVYGESKLAGEIATISNAEKHIILRTSWVFGETGNNFVKTMLKLGSEREELSIVADQRGGPTYSRDLVSSIEKIIEKIDSEVEVNWGIYHFSGVPFVSWFEFAENIFENAKLKNLLSSYPRLIEVSSEQFRTPAIRPKNSCLDCGKITNEFGVEPSDWKSATLNLDHY